MHTFRLSDGANRIKFTNTTTGLETVYFNDEVVSQQRSIIRSKPHIWSAGGSEYRLSKKLTPKNSYITLYANGSDVDSRKGTLHELLDQAAETNSNSDSKSGQKIKTPMGIAAFALLVCSWITNAIALNGLKSLIYLGILFALSAFGLGLVGLSKNSRCQASGAACGIGLIVAIAASVIAFIGIEKVMS
jgi:hypothetical protein